MKALVRDQVCVNLALCDQISAVQRRIARTQTQNCRLLLKLKEATSTQFKDVLDQLNCSYDLIGPSDSTETPIDQSNKSTSKTHQSEATAVATNQPDVYRSIDDQSSKLYVEPHLSQTLPPCQWPFSKCGEPRLPLSLDTLSLLGSGRLEARYSDTHRPNCLYPVGYSASRIYLAPGVDIDSSSGTITAVHCISYTCQVLPGESAPRFAITWSPRTGREKQKTVFGTSTDQCHRQLLHMLADTCRGPSSLQQLLARLTPSGDAFFGLLHPSVRCLLQSLPRVGVFTGRYRPVTFSIDEAQQPSLSGAKDSTISSSQSLSRASDPAASSEKSLSGASGPTASSQQSLSGDNEPTVPSEPPLSQASDPAVSSTQSLSGGNNHSVSPEQSLSGASGPAVSSQQSLSGASDPAVSPQQSPSGASDPAVSFHHSLSGADDPAVSPKQSLSGANDPAVSWHALRRVLLS